MFFLLPLTFDPHETSESKHCHDWATSKLGKTKVGLKKKQHIQSEKPWFASQTRKTLRSSAHSRHVNFFKSLSSRHDLCKHLPQRYTIPSKRCPVWPPKQGEQKSTSEVKQNVFEKSKEPKVESLETFLTYENHHEKLPVLLASWPVRGGFQLVAVDAIWFGDHRTSRIISFGVWMTQRVLEK